MHCVKDWEERNRQDEEASLVAYADEISRRVSELTAKTGEFYPFKQEHIMAFFGDMLPQHEAVMTVAIETPGADIANMLRHWITMYWESQAEKQAIRELENELKEHCHE